MTQCDILEDMSKPRVLIIVPAYNEEKTISSVCSEIAASGYDFIVVNDGSSDSTPKILDDLKIPHIDLISNLGIGGAIQTGYKYARYNDYDIAVQLDADGQHSVSCVRDIIQPIIDNKSDFVIGSRFIDKKSSSFHSTKLRRAGIYLISFIILLFSGKRIYDVTSGFRAANRKVIELFAEDYPPEYPEPVSEFDLMRHGYKILEVPVKMHERKGGKSSIHSWKNGYYVINVIISLFLIKLRRHKKDA